MVRSILIFFYLVSDIKNSNKFKFTIKRFEIFLKKAIIYQNFNSKNLNVNEGVFVILVE